MDSHTGSLTMDPVRPGSGGIQPRTREMPAAKDHILLRWLYERLTRKDPPRPADVIFVLAGRLERKHFGLELYRAGFAPRLILSVGRFEISKMAGSTFDFVADLKAVRDRTAPGRRHFFCDIDAFGTRICNAGLRRWSTYGEAIGFREYLADSRPARVIVVSTDIHLRRAALTFERVFRDLAVEFSYCPVPGVRSSLIRPEWWTRSADRGYVFSETLKLIGYRIILVMPDWMTRFLMRLDH